MPLPSDMMLASYRTGYFLSLLAQGSHASLISFQLLEVMRNLKMTRHNGRAGKNGVYNPKHNDRQFDLTNADHIDAARERQNIYWDCFQGFRTGMDDGQAHDSFEDVERQFYSIFYRESVEAQNERNIQNRHPERNRSTDDLLHDKRTCPEESILQIGNIDESVDGETLVKIACAFFTEMEERFGEHIHFLDWSLHMGEGTPHIHERHVFDADDGYGHAKPQQEKALEALGIELPDPSKKPGKNNNRKMTFDKICRDLFMEICERHDLYVDRDPTYGGRTYLEKQEYIIMAQKQRLEELEAELEAKTLKIQDVDAIVEEVSEAAYEKACEVVTETVQAETVKSDLEVIDEYRSWATAPERKSSPVAKSLIGQVVDAIQAKLKKAASTMLQRVSERLHEPTVKEANKAEIKTVARESILERLKMKQGQIGGDPSGVQKKKKNRDQER